MAIPARQAAEVEEAIPGRPAAEVEEAIQGLPVGAAAIQVLPWVAIRGCPSSR